MQCRLAYTDPLQYAPSLIGWLEVAEIQAYSFGPGFTTTRLQSNSQSQLQ